VTVFSALALAETWTGKLVDATCADQQQQSATSCNPTSATTMFAIVAGGKTYKLDDAGNTKAMDALKGRADRAADPNAPAAGGQISAKVTGTKQGDNTLKVDSIEVQ